MKKRIYVLPEGRLARKLYGDRRREVETIQGPIGDLMAKIEGAELVQDNEGFEDDEESDQSDEFHATYFVSPEAVVVHFDADKNAYLEIYAFGSSNEAIDRITERISQVFANPEAR